MSAFEVHCHHCKVSFPLGTRRCLHCGGLTGRPSLSDLSRELTIDRTGPRSLPEEVEEPSQRGAMRAISGVMWALLILMASLYRICGG